LFEITHIAGLPEIEQENIAERLILAARCQGNSLVHLDEKLIDNLLTQLIFYIMIGHLLVVIKVIEALKYIKGQSIFPVIEHLMTHKSLWVQNETMALIARH
jgi:hypothetical protein